jgi:uncharacterized protein
MTSRPFSLVTPDGELIRGDLRLPTGPPPRSAVLVVHGFKGFKDWGFFPHVCETLAGEGHAVVSFNFSRNGVTDDPGTFSDLDAFARNTFTRELGEIRRLLIEIREGDLLPRRVRRIGLLGHSRGGGSAVLAAGEDGELDALVTWAAVDRFDRWADETKEEWRRERRIHVLNARTGQQMPLDVTLLDDFEANVERLDILDTARRLETPWLIVHGEADASVPADEARELARASPGAALEIIPGAGHTFEAIHPFAGSTPELDRALEVTGAHFRRHLLGPAG